MSDKKYDVVVFGATGFTGRLVAEYLDQQYNPSQLNWAMAGRSQDKLQQIRSEMGISDKIDLHVANSAKPETLKELAQSSKVVLTTVGPYQLYGTELVRACVESGTDYVDLSGEPAWMHDTIEEFDVRAKETGARIVHSCGFDSIPFDLGVYFTQKTAKEKFGVTCPRIKGRVRKMKGTFSGGTKASFMATMMRVGKEPEVLDWLKDPFSLAPGFTGAPQPPGHKPIYDEDLNSWSAPFIMASINTKNIHRSNTLLDHAYGQDFVYDEMVLTGPGEKGQQAAEFLAKDDSFAKNPVKPGEGPSKEERENGHYDVMFVGDTANGERVITSVTGDKDPGYGSTSKMIAESAVCLAKDNLQTGGGVFTPAPAMGEALIKRLVDNAGLTFSVEN